MQLAPGQKVYFLSDFHLGVPGYEASRERERKIVAFLDSIETDAHSVFIVGDMFDFWYEYKYVVPKGFVRILGKLAELSDHGVNVHFFVGNHDMWMKDYFQTELGVPVYFDAKTFEFNGRSFYIAHGDGMGPGDHRYKFMKKIFRNPLCQYLFGILPPSVGMGLANYSSRRSREKAGENHLHFLGENEEWLVIHSKDLLKHQHFDFFVYGHRHVPIHIPLGKNSQYVNLGDWMRHFTYAVFDGSNISLQKFVS